MKPGKMKRGLTIIEVLMGLSIASMLLLAVGTAMLAVTQSVRTNDSYMRARNGAEGALKLMITKVRRAKEFTLETSGGTEFTRLRVLDDGTWDDVNNCWSANNAKWSIFEVINNELVMKRVKSDGSGAISDDGTFPLSRHVRNTSFRTVVDSGTNRSVIIDMTVDSGDAFNSSKTTSFPLSGTAMARSLSKDS